MAAEDDGAKSDKSAGERQRGRERSQKPPVTIDLTAERVSATEAEPGAEAEAETPQPETASPAPAETTPEPGPAAAATLPPGDAGKAGKGEPPRATRPPGASAIGSDDGWARPAIAGVVGGLIALVVLVVLQATGLVPSPGRSAASQAVEQAKAANDAVAAIDRRLSAVEMITQNLPAKGAIDALSGRLDKLEAAQGGLASKSALTTLSDDVAGLKAKVDAIPPGATHDEVAALAKRVTQLEAGAAGGNGGSVDSAAVTALSDRIDSVQASIKTLGERVSALEAKASTSAADSTRAARAIAVVALRRAAEGGAPFTTDLNLAAALGVAPDEVAALKPLAETGAPTRATLTAAFPAVGDAIIRATTRSNPNAGFFERLLTSINGLVSVRPAGPVAGNDPPAIVSRMRAAVDKGDFATALKERDGLPDAGKAASADWAKQAQDRATIDALVAKIAQAATAPTGNGPT